MKATKKECQDWRSMQSVMMIRLLPVAADTHKVYVDALSGHDAAQHSESCYTIEITEDTLHLCNNLRIASTLAVKLTVTRAPATWRKR